MNNAKRIDKMLTAIMIVCGVVYCFVSLVKWFLPSRVVNLSSFVMLSLLMVSLLVRVALDVVSNKKNK